MRIHNFLNLEVRHCIPDGQVDTWGNYKEADSFRMALITAESWKQQGWTPVRYGTRNHWSFGKHADGDGGIHFQSPILRDSLLKGYGYSYWNNWFSIEELFDRETVQGEWLWFTTNDVINWSFTPEQARDAEQTADIIGANFINCEALRHSHAVFACKRSYASEMIGAILDVDLGIVTPDTTITLVSDESIARDFLTKRSAMLANCCIRYCPKTPLNHIARSLLVHIETDVPKLV